jgi:hypothetical protein
MNCYVCATTNTATAAVAICPSCQAGLCLRHVREAAATSSPGGTSIIVGCHHNTWPATDRLASVPASSPARAAGTVSRS